MKAVSFYEYVIPMFVGKRKISCFFEKGWNMGTPVHSCNETRFSPFSYLLNFRCRNYMVIFAKVKVFYGKNLFPVIFFRGSHLFSNKHCSISGSIISYSEKTNFLQNSERQKSFV